MSKMDEIECLIKKNARAQPKALALITDEMHYTYGELDALITHLCKQLMQQGIGANSRVAFVAPTSILTVSLLCALFRLKATACPLSFRLPIPQIDKAIQRLCATHILDINQLCVTKEHCFAPDASWDLDSAATFLFTSGSSCTPKIACHSLSNHLFSALGAIPALTLTETSRYLLSLPLFHVSGIAILMRTFLSGCTLVISKHPPCISLNTYQVTHASFVPTQLYRLMQDPNWHPTHLTCALIGGAALSQTLGNEALQRGLPLMLTYGMTEMSSMVFCGQATCTHPPSGALLNHRELQRDSTGELLVRGKTLFQGYWNTSTQRYDLPLKDGWFATGDLGELLEDGTWIFTSRKDRMFISGGENIQPEEIEQALCKLPGILAAKVVPLPDAEFGARPVAYVLEKSPLYDIETIKEQLKAFLPSFKHPIQLYPFTDEMLEGLKVKILAPERTLESCDQRIHAQS